MYRQFQWKKLTRSLSNPYANVPPLIIYRNNVRIICIQQNSDAVYIEIIHPKYLLHVAGSCANVYQYVACGIVNVMVYSAAALMVPILFFSSRQAQCNLYWLHTSISHFQGPPQSRHPSGLHCRICLDTLLYVIFSKRLSKFICIHLLYFVLTDIF